MNHKPLTDAEVEESIRFARGALAASGAFVDDESPVLSDGRAALRGEITFDEAIERAAARVLGTRT